MKIVSSLLFTLLIALAFTGAANAWEWTAHKNIVDEVYSNLPTDVQHNLKPYIPVMKEGSTYPDVYDTVDNKKNHKYPDSYPKANEWLDKGKVAYEKKDYKESAWCFGVASHYISDTFAAPHCDWINNKEEYWKIGNSLTPKKHDFKYSNLNTMLQYGKQRGAESVKNWNNKEDKGIVQQDLNRGTSATYAAILYHAHPSMIQSDEYSDL